MALQECGFFHEKPETKPERFTWPRCRHRDERSVRWMLRTRKDRIPPGADDRDRALHGRLRNCLIRVDDVLVCRRCQPRLETPSQQSFVSV